MKQLGFFIDVEQCTGCKTCVVACNDKNNLPADLNFRRVAEFSGGDWEKDPKGGWNNSVFAYYISLSCNHCDQPACVAVCPTGAHFKRADNGLVVINPEKCIGCGACIVACPYGAPQLDKSIGKTRKCDACWDLVAIGRQPVCVEACPQRALDFGEIEELRSRHGKLAAIAPLPSAEKTKPNLVIHPSKNCKEPGTKGDIHSPFKA